MAKRIDELLAGNLDLNLPGLLSSEKEINLILPLGCRYKQAIKIGTAQGRCITGNVYSDSHRIVFAQDSFSGSSCAVVFGIDTRGLKEADEISADIVFVTDVGQLRIPVFVLIEDELPKPFDKIRDLDNFAVLASENYREAFMLYTNSGFTSLLKGEDAKFLLYYRGLSQNPVTYQHLEEFLVASGKKSPVRLSVDGKDKISYTLNDSFKDTLRIKKSTWGYVRAEVFAEGDFINIDKKLITSENFVGGVCPLEFVLDAQKLRGKAGRGRIILRTVYEELSIEIEAVRDAGMKLIPSRWRKTRLLSILRAFLSLQLKKTDYRTWYENTRRWIDELKEDSENIYTVFAEAYLAECQDDKTELIRLLWPFKTGEIKLIEPWEKALYLYLAKEADLLPDKKNRIIPKLYSYYQQDPGNYLILAIYLKSLEAKGYVSPWGLSELEKVHELGCRSPFLYLQAWRLLSAREALLRSLSPFIVRVLSFAQKEGLITEGLLVRASYLTANIRGSSFALYDLLTKGYEKYGRREILEAICRYIMNEKPLTPSYYKWYEKAVAENIRLTRLYEYYLQTRPEDLNTPLPKSVKLYFAYTSTISQSKKAYLYSEIIKDKQNDPVSYRNYEKVAASFAFESIKKGYINEYYAVLYKEFFSNCENAETARYLFGVLFRHKLTCRDQRIRRVVICHKQLKDIHSYAVNGGKAYPEIYGSDVCILFEDDKKRRYAATVEYTLEPLLNIEDLALKCMSYGIWDTKMQLYCCFGGELKRGINSLSLGNFWKAAENVYFTREFRDSIRKKLLCYFAANSEDFGLSPYIESMKELTYGQIDKPKTYELLIKYGKYSKAFNLINVMGYEGISAVSLLKLAGALLQNGEREENEELLDLICYVYRQGCFNEALLSYIAEFAVLDLHEFEGLWVNMRSFGMDTYTVAERYLLLSSFVLLTSKNSENILEDYIGKNGSPEVIEAYLNFLSLLTLVKNRQFNPRVFEIIKELCEKDPSRSLICDLAFLKYKSRTKKFSDDEIPLLKSLLAYCDLNGKRFWFFKRFPEEIISGLQLEDKVFAQESFPARNSVTIHYRTGSLNSEAGDWKHEPLAEIITGIYSREFLLFYGEYLEYYCTVNLADESFDTKIKKLSVPQSSVRGRSKYQMLNRMLMQRDLKLYDKAEKTMERFLWQENFIDNMFSIKE